MRRGLTVFLRFLDLLRADEAFFLEDVDVGKAKAEVARAKVRARAIRDRMRTTASVYPENPLPSSAGSSFAKMWINSWVK